MSIQNEAFSRKIRMVELANASNPVTGILPGDFSVYLCKAAETGFSDVSAEVTIAEDGFGWYEFDFTATHADTLGQLAIHVEAPLAASFDDREDIEAPAGLTNESELRRLGAIIFTMSFDEIATHADAAAKDPTYGYTLMPLGHMMKSNVSRKSVGSTAEYRLDPASPDPDVIFTTTTPTSDPEFTLEGQP